MNPESHTISLEQLLGQHRPARLLAVGSLACRLAQAHPEQLAGCELALRPSEDAAALFDSDAAVDLALVEGGPGGPAAATAPLLLARLRDVLARVTLVLVPTDPPASPPWRREDLRALGYVRAGRLLWDEAALDVYRFDIATYKTTPDWLNPEGWAHPELWDRYRW